MGQGRQHITKLITLCCNDVQGIHTLQYILPVKFLKDSGLEVMKFTKSKEKNSKPLNFRFRSGMIKKLVIKTPGFIML